MILVAPEEYDRLVEAAEELDDIVAFDAAMREDPNARSADRAFTVTRRGRAVAVFAPIERRRGDDLVLREASSELVFPVRIPLTESTADVLAELRGER